MGKKFHQLINTATRADWVDSMYFAVDSETSGTKKLAASILVTILNNFAKEFKSDVACVAGKCYWKDGVLYKCKNAHSGTWSDNDFDVATVDDVYALVQYGTNKISELPDKNEGYLALNDANGTGKFDIDTIFANFAGKFDPAKPNDADGYAYYASEIVIYNGATYKFKVNHVSGAWNSAEVERYDTSSILKFFLVTDNPEYVYAITDTNGVLLFGIKADGSVEWQVGIPSPIKAFIESFIATLNSRISDLEENKVDKVPDKSLTPNILANNVFSSDNVEYAMVMLDASEKFLFGIRKDGSVDSLIFEDFIENALNNKFRVASQSYVDEKVLAEKNRSIAVENDLQTQINNINPTIVEGGENNPDEVFLTAINDTITLKNTNAGVNGKKVAYVRPSDVLASTLVDTDTIYIFKFGKEIGQNTVVIPARCVLVFEGGYLYGGTIQGTDTIVTYKNGVFASDVVITGTWDIPYIRSDILIDAVSNNALKMLNALQSNSRYNVVHVLPGNYVFDPVENGDSLLTPKTNTKLIIDGIITVEPNGFTHYEIVLIKDVDNVEVTGCGKLVGDTNTHHYEDDPTKTHEHCHGIYSHYDNIVTRNNHGHYNIHDMTIHDFPGDGIDVCGNDIVIRNVKIYHCGRQGISVEDSRRVLIENVDISDIYRTAPKAGIDIEPWLTDAKNITIKNVTLENCYGLQIYADVENAHISNVTMKNVTKVLTCSSIVKNAVLENVSVVNSQAPTMSIAAGADVRISGMKISSVTSGDIDISNALLLFDCDFENLNITGMPKKGSIRYDGTNNRYLQYNGSSWTNF